MKLNFSSKVISRHAFIALCFVVFGSLILSYVTFGEQNLTKLTAVLQDNVDKGGLVKAGRQREADGLKNILMWTHNYTEPFNFFRQGREQFISEGCQFNNCYLSNDRNYLDNITEWDVLLFHAPEFTLSGNSWGHAFPSARAHEQRYTLVSVESSHNYPICDQRWEGYFNWTMTYMLDSDVPWEYVVVRDLNTRQIVAPAKDVHWQENMSILTDEMKNRFKNKTKAAAWIVSNCNSQGKREDYVKVLKTEMENLGMVLDVYGECGDQSCDHATCFKKLEEDYLFYLSFENSFSPDYVTEKLLTAVQHDVVPIVWGGADYSRFLPPNSYIDARKHTAQELAALVLRLTQNIDEYAEMTRWRQHYSYHSVYDSPDTHPLCKLCRALNDPLMMQAASVKGDIRSWWNGEHGSGRCPT